MTIVRRIADVEYNPTPEGWMVVGELNLINTLSGIVGKNSQWINVRLPQIIQEIQREQKESGILFKEREKFAEIYLDKSNRPNMHYSPLVLERLRKLAEVLTPVPEGWLTIGNMSKKNKSSITSILDRNINWVKDRLSQVIEELQKEQEEKGIPLEERDPIFGDFLAPNGDKGVYYSPLVLDRLSKLLEKFIVPPDGWMIIGDMRDEGTMAFTLQKSSEWFKTRLPIVIETLEREQREKGEPEHKREDLYGEFTNKKRRKSTYYSPLVLSALKSLFGLE